MNQNNSSQLIVVSGPSGVGKNTLIDLVLEEIPEIQYFRKIITRTRRPDDRDEEADFLSIDQFEDMKAKRRIAFQYELRGKDNGIPIDSLTSMKDGTRICALGDFELVQSFKDSFHVTAVYVTANIDQVVDRLNNRQDTPEQRAKSIAAGPTHLAEFAKRNELFDYVVDNTNIDDAREAMLRIAKYVIGQSSDYDHPLLTKQQHVFLNDGSIRKINTIGESNIRTIEIERKGKSTILHMDDVHDYIKRSNSPAHEGYAKNRLPIYTKLLGVEPENLGDATYKFSLPDGAKVIATFRTIKDRS